jgi:CheY-like chemotaxis protein
LLMPLVLVVDDSHVARRVLARRLTSEGFQVKEAPSVKDARKVDVTALACAIIDLELADGDGTDLADALLARRTTLPLAFFTTGTSPALVQSARACGPVFVKPDVEPLLAWVKRTLRPSQPPPTK